MRGGGGHEFGPSSFSKRSADRPAITFSPEAQPNICMASERPSKRLREAHGSSTAAAPSSSSTSTRSSSLRRYSRYSASRADRLEKRGEEEAHLTRQIARQIGREGRRRDGLAEEGGDRGRSAWRRREKGRAPPQEPRALQGLPGGPHAHSGVAGPHGPEHALLPERGARDRCAWGPRSGRSSSRRSSSSSRRGNCGTGGRERRRASLRRARRRHASRRTTATPSS